MAYDPSYAQYIDHTVLKADTTQETLLRFCSEAKQYHFASVCVNPCNVAFVARQLEGSGVKTAAVVGFPLGANKRLPKHGRPLPTVLRKLIWSSISAH